ncbi:hypothetical protein TPHA_0I00700 [Tetrapisispora phaffii CBS 4417]|uniref:Uncharacterized protein n=1 Tax=Tetrapisispora phaffii (strain ATCC 24235 / CBS 4417 / NBRC 1672 / NRRL Y-8282 / UCD 70-5) TaxID=1071381 RepID=G8BXE8_TETPH|nr:hypothetical protein TPHA_0I00700 [Tetrapisispora phaffii CBS 4417]CCE64576.1 hypothetical protein TPHA_0I00700 [Tetrapisispora phaffii CBS 4417]
MSSDEISIHSVGTSLEKSEPKLATSGNQEPDTEAKDTITVYDLVSQLQESLTELDKDLDTKNETLQQSIKKIENKLTELTKKKK